MGPRAGYRILRIMMADLGTAFCGHPPVWVRGSGLHIEFPHFWDVADRTEDPDTIQGICLWWRGMVGQCHWTVRISRWAPRKVFALRNPQQRADISRFLHPRREGERERAMATVGSCVGFFLSGQTLSTIRPPIVTLRRHPFPRSIRASAIASVETKPVISLFPLSLSFWGAFGKLNPRGISLFGVWYRLES